MARPPIKAAHDYAVKKLVQAHNDEWQTLVDEYLASTGWTQEEVTKKVWVAPKKEAT